MSQSLKAAALAVVLLGLVVPTGAVVTESVDDVFSKNGVVMKPFDGPNGEYAEIGDDGELSVDVTDPGVNDEGVTVIRQVFVIENRGERPTTVWLTHDATDGVTLYENITSGVLDTRAIAKQSLQGTTNRTTIDPGERIVVSLAIDTNSPESEAGELLLETVTLHVRQEPATPTATATATPTDTPTPTRTRTSTGTRPPTEPRTPTETEPIPVNETGAVAVRFTAPELANESVTVTAVDPASVPESGDPDPDPRPQAVITRPQSERQQAVNRTTRNLSGVDSIVTTKEAATLDATRSTVDRTDGVNRQKRIVKAVEISPPKGLEDQSATVRMRISKEQLGATKPENARVGRLTSTGWQLLETSVVEETSDSVLLEAETPGFSLFAVFASPDVSYEWTLPNGTTVDGSAIRERFTEPGYYNVTLTVTDAYGNADSTQYRILANDVPDVTIETPANASVGETVRLRANVTNQYGNTTISWELPNGSEATGRTVNYTLQSDTPEIEVTVVDEYGANATATATIPTDGARDDPGRGQLGTVVAKQFPVVSWILLVGVTVFLVVVGRRLTNLEPRAPLSSVLRLLRARSRPRITHLENPRWDAHRGRFELDRLRVEANTDALETVAISLVAPDGTDVARKRIDLGSRDVYEASPEFIPGIPRSSVDPALSYTVRVQAVDSRSRETFATSAIQVGFSGQGARNGAPGAD